ncbi:phage holin family protein [Arcanobacterium hippocoleae]
MRFLITSAINAAALWITTLFLSGIRLEGEVRPESFLADTSIEIQRLVYFLLAGAALAIVNMAVRPIVKLLSLPFYILTLGLFFIVVNALMLMLTAWITSHLSLGLVVDGFWWAVAGGIWIGIINTVLWHLLPKLKD